MALPHSRGVTCRSAWTQRVRRFEPAPDSRLQSFVSHPMPIVDVELVRATGRDAPSVSADAPASALGAVFGSPPGHAWVRVRFRPSPAYAGNDLESSPEQLPVFVADLQARWPGDAALAGQVREVTDAVAACLSLPPESVHVEYAPEGAGRQAFGGTLVG